MTNKITIKIILILLTTTLSSIGMSNEFAVITNIDNKLDSLSAKDVRSIYLGRKNSINSIVIKPVQLVNGNAAHEFLLQNIIGKKPKQYKAYWTRLIFSGKSAPITTLKSEQEVLNWIQNNSNGIGYISTSAITDKVKVLYQQ